MENESPGIPEGRDGSAQPVQPQRRRFRRLVRRWVVQPSRSTWHAYLGELLASRGFIGVSVDENFLNGSWASGIGKENGVRAWILLQHLAAWRKWNTTTSNPFQGKVDLDSIALDRFAWVGAFSSGGLGEDFNTTFPSLDAKANGQLRLLRIACGKDDRLVESNRKFVEWLKSKEVRSTYVETSGAHTWMVWRRYLAEFAPLLFQ